MFVDGTEIYKFKAKDSETVPSPLCLGNISNGWSVDNMKKTLLFMILVLIMMQLLLMTYYTFTNTWWKKWHTVTKCLSLLKYYFLTGLAFLSTLTSVNSLSCIQWTIKSVDQKLLIGMILSFILLALKQENAVEAAAISTIHMQKSGFLMLFKTWMSKHSI